MAQSEKRRVRYEGKKTLLQALISHLAAFRLPPLPVEKEFHIDEYLASIIHNPEDDQSVYHDAFQKARTSPKP